MCYEPKFCGVHHRSSYCRMGSSRCHQWYARTSLCSTASKEPSNIHWGNGHCVWLRCSSRTHNWRSAGWNFEDFLALVIMSRVFGIIKKLKLIPCLLFRCFYINLFLAAPTLIAGLFFVKVPKQPVTQNSNINQSFKDKFLSLDPLGLLLLLPWVTSFILALQFGSTQFSWGNGRTIACFVVSGVLFIVFWAEQWWMGEKALVPPRLLKMRVVGFGAVYALAIDSTFYTLVYYVSCLSILNECDETVLTISLIQVPLWFQAIKGASPFSSGVRYFAFAIPLVLAVFGGGFGVTKLGYYQPFMLASTILSSVGAGLLSTLTVHSGADRWIPYLVITGLGVGIGEQQPAIAVQSTLDPADVPIGVAFILFVQSFGPTVFITVAQTVFSEILTSKLQRHLPGLDATAIKNAGATQLESFVPVNDRPAVRAIYNLALTRTYLVSTAMACATVLGLAGIGLSKIPQEEELDVEKVDEVKEKGSDST